MALIEVLTKDGELRGWICGACLELFLDGQGGGLELVRHP